MIAHLEIRWKEFAMKRQNGLFLNLILGVFIILAIIFSWTHAYISQTERQIPDLPSIQPHQSTLQNIAEWHLFGIPSTSMPDIEVMKTNLPLKLEGVFIAEDNNNSRAIISVAGQPAKLFNVGQTMMANVVLLKVFQNMIYLSNQGKTEKLLIPKPGSEQLSS
jgi:type II secretory pathway component PulC